MVYTSLHMAPCALFIHGLPTTKTVFVTGAGVCSLPADAGSCVGSFPRFYYDSTSGRCQPFEYGGCRGNQNRFDSLEECGRTCEAIMSSGDTGMLLVLIIFSHTVAK